MRSVAYILTQSGDMSANFTSPNIIIDQVGCLSIHCIWTGSPVGNLIVQANNIVQDIYADIPPSLISINGSGQVVYNVYDFGYQNAQIYYQAISGTGNLYISVGKKGF